MLWFLLLSVMLDINTASFDDYNVLPISEDLRCSIYNYVVWHNGISSVYELLNVDGMTVEDFKKIKPLIVVRKEKKDRRQYYIDRLQERLAREESPTRVAIDEWEDMLIFPLYINRASVDELLVLDRVSVVDAVSVVKHRRMWGNFRYPSSLRRAFGLSYYGYRNILNFITFDAPTEGKYPAKCYLKIGASLGNAYTGENVPSAVCAELSDRISSLAPGSEDSLYEVLIAGDWDTVDVDSLRCKLQDKLSALGDLTPMELTAKLRVSWAGKVKAGVVWRMDEGVDRGVKGYASVKATGPVDRLVMGHYRVILGQGLLMDNTDEVMYRTAKRIQGVYGDLTSNYHFTFLGGAVRMKAGAFMPLVFFSSACRQGVFNLDGSVLTYFPALYPVSKDTFREDLLGWSLRANTDEILGMDPGSYVAFNGYTALYNRLFSPQATLIDIPSDKEELLECYVNSMFEGDRRSVLGVDFRATVGNMSMCGEWAYLVGGGSAYYITGRVQYNSVYVMAAFRHYDADYDNPYHRGFMEQKRFDDTILEKDYRLLDPTLVYLVDYPTPKPEEGFYLETRVQLGRKWTITRAYVDVWRSLFYSGLNWRFQSEIEYRPVHPLRIRLRQKFQRKCIPKAIVASRSLVSETTLRSFVAIGGKDYLSVEARWGRVYLTPNPLYGENAQIAGSFLSANWEHKFSEGFAFLGGVAVWDGSDMSQWIFEDTGIDFLYGKGYKYYIVASDRLSKNVYIRCKVIYKRSFYPHTGLENQELVIEDERGYIPDFISEDGVFVPSMMISVMW